MKLYLLFLLALLLCCRTDDGFVKIPKTMHEKDRLILQIIPNRKYTYWECIFKDMIDGKARVVLNSGDSSTVKAMKHKVPDRGFLTEIWSGYYYIAYIENDSLKYITDNNKLKQFIGNIDNLGEALLIAEAHNLGFNNSKKIGGAYKKYKSGFELYLTKYYKCPYREEAFQAFIDLKGNFEFKSQNIFLNVNESLCID